MLYGKHIHESHKKDTGVTIFKKMADIEKLW